MRVAELDYDLPPELIAQEPARPRDSSRLLVLHRESGEIEHRLFRDFVNYLDPNDVVVLNDTKVIRARLKGRRRPGGGKAEVLLLSRQADGDWEALVTPGRRLGPGREIEFGEGELWAEILDRTASGGRLLRFHGAEEIEATLARLGEVPAPPYINHPIAQESDYQTIFARALGASAAPTAGLHFTPEMMEQVRARVQAVAYLTLHIGLGTFRPIHAENVEDHDMHVESYVVPESTAQLVSKARAEGRRIVAVGTSTARTLEAATENNRLQPGAGETDLYIRPGYHFKTVGALLTNFHLPRSTLLLLICALAGKEQIFRAYREAVAMKYRFLSFGDAMLII